MTLSDHSTVDEDENLDLETESQDEEDMGHGARAGGGFTSAVSSLESSLKSTLN